MFLRRRLINLASGVVLCCLAAGCGSTDTAQPSATTTGSAATGTAATGAATATPTTATTATGDVPDVLDFSAPLLSAPGTTASIDIEAASFAGQPVAFWFWAPG